MSKLRDKGVERPYRAIKDGVVHRGMLVILDTADQGQRRPGKVARLMQGDSTRHELADVHIVWCSEGRLTLAGFERRQNERGEQVDYAQSWLCTLDAEPIPELELSKLRNVRPSV